MTAPAARVANGRRGIFLYGYYGAGNLGDDLLLVAAIDILHAVFPGYMIYVRDHGDTRALNIGASVTFTGIETILSDSRSGNISRFARYLGAYVRVLRRCEWLVFGGGTVFHEVGTIRPLVLQWLICLVARVCGARIAALGVGVSDLQSSAARWLLRGIIRMSEIFLVRDDAAVNQCAAAGVMVERTGDLVFNLTPIVRPSVTQNAVALTVAPASFRSEEARERALTELASGVRQWGVQGRRVVLLVFQRAGVTPGDEPFLAALSERLSDVAIEVRTLVPERRMLDQAFADIAVVCGMRFHALVLAAMAGVPFVGLAHDNKIEDICRRFDMPVLSAFAFTHQELTAAVAAVAARRPGTRALAECVTAAAANASLLRRVASP